jgi:hypothetical protein
LERSANTSSFCTGQANLPVYTDSGQGFTSRGADLSDHQMRAHFNAARLALGTAVLLAIWLRLAVARALLAVALACQDRLDSLLLTWFQIESVPLNFLNNFLLQNLALEAA